ncbi:MAG: S1-like domain-containing RNA-binding protein [Bacteroidetes bacterium]|jgi:predicted RNA-binding protein (virulence factor B family)|nr:S1-like domain-containing RNA-binding protein [Bacteroidota bacterium]
MIELGKFNTLFSNRITENGMYLRDEDDNEVLLPNKYVPEDMLIDDEIEVFVYNDSQDRPVATTRKPRLMLNEFGYLKVVEVNAIGAFLDWGLEKDILVPFREQKMDMIVGRYYLVYIYVDDKTDRLVGTAKVRRYFETENISVKEGEEVDLLICEMSDLGVNVVINNTHSGLIFKNLIHKPLIPGQRMKGYIKTIRPDNKIDVVLEKQGYQNIIEPNSKKILEQLQLNNGFLQLNDKSDPAEISERLHMSKKTFKKAIGALYKQRLIKLENGGVRLVE